MNLCTNAWHALEGRPGQIGVVLREAVFASDDAGRPPALAPGRWAQLQVSDTGCGIDPAAQQRIFEPFFTTKSVGQGTGLGLAVVHGIVSAHHGLITVHSRLGAGSHFDVYLPLAAAPAALPGTAGAPGTPDFRVGRGQHVLYVDDDEVMLLMTERLLQRAGYRVSCLMCAGDAIQRLAQRPLDIDLVVTDYNMPDGSGLDVARAVQRLRRPPPVVLSSGYLPEAVQAEAAAVGVRALLKKECTFDDLVALVHRLLQQPA